ncbi:ribosomal protein S18-alanine N-acetyltransferase [Candidatus Bathyarchaeota archaeon]|nr:ribosomal protein S18-alanine N-acetyltransferase [Candidatus Bathyarchaeota archaeon]
MDIIIKKANLKDISTIKKIEENIYPDPWPPILFKFLLSRSPDLFFVAVHNEEIIGYIIGEVISKKGILFGHVLNIAVKVDWRKKGIGQNLLYELEKKFLEKKVTLSYLEVRESNLIAQNLYIKNGYKTVDVLELYYKDENGLRMEKNL